MSKRPLITVRPWGAKYALIWGGWPDKLILDKAGNTEPKTFETEALAQEEADRLNKLYDKQSDT